MGRIKVGSEAKKAFAGIAKMARDKYRIELNIEKAVRLDSKDLGTIIFAPPKSPLFEDYADVERGIILGAVYVDLTKEIYTYSDKESKIKIPKGAYLLKATGKVGEWIPTEYVNKEGKVVAKTNQIYIRKLPRLEPVAPFNEPKAVITELPGVGVMLLASCSNRHTPECFYVSPSDATAVWTGK